MRKLSEVAKMWLDKLHNFINATAHAELSAAVDRLAAYEDTGLTPEVCAEYRKFEDEVVVSGMSFGELVELMHKERTRWIPVSERLPNVCGFKCLVCAKNKFEQTHIFTAFTGYMERGKLEFHSCEPKYDDLSVWEITHWMPLPEAPKEEQDERND